MDRRPATAPPSATSARCSRAGGVAQPDVVDYAPDEIVFRWSEEKLAVVLDLESPPGCVPVPP